MDSCLIRVISFPTTRYVISPEFLISMTTCSTTCPPRYISFHLGSMLLGMVNVVGMLFGSEQSSHRE